MCLRQATIRSSVARSQSPRRSITQSSMWSRAVTSQLLSASDNLRSARATGTLDCGLAAAVAAQIGAGAAGVAFASWERLGSSLQSLDTRS